MRKFKKMVVPSLMAMMCVGAIASTASAQSPFAGLRTPDHPGTITEDGSLVVSYPEGQTFHTVQTPTGALQVPDILHGTGMVYPEGATKKSEGEFFEWNIEPCERATPEQAGAYTEAEINADPGNWCFQAPGTISATHKSKAAKAHRSHGHGKAKAASRLGH